MRRRQLQLLEGGCAGGRFLWGTKGTAMSSLGFGSSTICNPFARHSLTRGAPRAPTAFIFHRSRSTFLPSLHLRSSKNSSTLRLRIGAAATFSASSFLLVSSFVHASSSTSASSPFAAVFAQEEQRQVAAKAEEQEQEREQQPVDPLQEDTRMSVYEWIKTVLGGLFLVPLRLSIIVPSCLATYVLVKMGLVALNALEKVSAGRFNRARWRQLLFALPLRCMLRGMLFVTGFYWLEVKGRPADLSEVSILVCNHTSQLDPILLLAATGQVPSMVSKASIQRLPCVGEVASALDCVFVERMDSKSRVAALDAIKQRAKRRHGPQLLIFPEGTITNGKALLSFRAGAFTPGMPVQPICIRYPHQHFHPTFVGHTLPKDLFVFFRIFCQLWSRAEITYLPVYHPSKEEQSDPFLFARNVAEEMSKYLQVPISELTYRDALLKRGKGKVVHASSLPMDPTPSPSSVVMPTTA